MIQFWSLEPNTGSIPSNPTSQMIADRNNLPGRSAMTLKFFSYNLWLCCPLETTAEPTCFCLTLYPWTSLSRDSSCTPLQNWLWQSLQPEVDLSTSISLWHYTLVVCMFQIYVSLSSTGSGDGMVCISVWQYEWQLIYPCSWVITAL